MDVRLQYYKHLGLRNTGREQNVDVLLRMPVIGAFAVHGPWHASPGGSGCMASG